MTCWFVARRLIAGPGGRRSGYSAWLSFVAGGADKQQPAPGRGLLASVQTRRPVRRFLLNRARGGQLDARPDPGRPAAGVGHVAIRLPRRVGYPPLRRAAARRRRVHPPAFLAEPARWACHLAHDGARAPGDLAVGKPAPSGAMVVSASAHRPNSAVRRVHRQLVAGIPGVESRRGARPGTCCTSSSPPGGLQ